MALPDIRRAVRDSRFFVKKKKKLAFNRLLFLQKSSMLDFRLDFKRASVIL